MVNRPYALSDGRHLDLTTRPIPSEVGESILGVRFFKTVNHTVVTRTKLSYFFDAKRRCSGSLL